MADQSPPFRRLNYIPSCRSKKLTCDYGRQQVLTRYMQFIRGHSELIIVYSVVPAGKIGKGAVSYEEADETEASYILLAF